MIRFFKSALSVVATYASYELPAYIDKMHVIHEDPNRYLDS